MSVGDLVSISLGNEHNLYGVRKITPEGIYISPLTDSSKISIIVQTEHGWQVWGTDIKFDIQFYSPESIVNGPSEMYAVYPRDDIEEQGRFYKTKERAIDSLIYEILTLSFRLNDSGNVVYTISERDSDFYMDDVDTQAGDYTREQLKNYLMTMQTELFADGYIVKKIPLY